MQTQVTASVVASTGSKTGSTRYVYAVVGFFIFIGALVAGFIFDAAETKWVTGLFLIPPLAAIVGVGIHVWRGNPTSDGYFYDFSMKVSFFSTFFYCGLWVLYCLGQYAQWLSIAALIGIVVLLSLMGIMMCAFLHDLDQERWPRLLALRNGASNEQLWALCFLFFVLFLDVAYLFGFAFAFHDRASLSATHAPALHMANIVSPDDIRASGSSEAAKDTGRTIDLKQASPSDHARNNLQLNRDPNFYFYFEPLRARLEQPENVICDPPPSANGEVEPPQRLSWVSRDPKQYNFCSLQTIKLRIEHETHDGNRVRVILVGRSDDHPIKGSNVKDTSNQFLDYKSNYELSEARAQNVRYEVIKTLKEQDRSPQTWLNLEWLSLPSSNEIPIETDQQLQEILQETNLDKMQKETFIDRNKRVVIASVVSIPGELSSLQMRGMWPKAMNLMDYMYFSIYTITTTGYGDIIPTTGYAKFVVSFANVCEVLFLVVFVNALISLKVRKKIRHRSAKTSAS
ncbi:MAG TPA: ion channel [Pyrinomonadaceae bacterium]|nr:ion channel [Pyrinomonadaceae bacterium]